MHVDTLVVLEKKIIDLIEKVKFVQAENTQLVQENVRLKNDLKTLEERVLNGTMNVEELSQERATTKIVVEDLIKHIDLLIEKNQ